MVFLLVACAAPLPPSTLVPSGLTVDAVLSHPADAPDVEARAVPAWSATAVERVGPCAVSTLIAAPDGVVYGCAEGDLRETGEGGQHVVVAGMEVDALVRHGEDVWACGRAPGGDAGDGLVYRRRGGEWSTVLREGDVAMDHCGALAVLDDGRVLVVEADGGEATWSRDDGATWSAATFAWTLDDVAEPQPDGWWATALASDGSSIWGVGEGPDGEAVVFVPSLAAGPELLDAVEVPADEVGAVAPLGPGDAWVGGTADGRAWLAHTTDSGSDWGAVPLPWPGVTVDALGFAADGTRGLLLTSAGGTSAVLSTADGGHTWAVVATGGSWSSLTVDADGAWLAAGSGPAVHGTGDT